MNRSIGETSTGDVVMRPRVAGVIERLGAGPYLLKEVCLGGSVWLVAGLQIVVITATTKAIADDWHLQGWQRSSIVSVLFVGILFGNVSSGPFSDMFGRRLPIVLAYAAVLIFGMSSAFAPGFLTLCICRLLLGFSFGFSQPAWHALCTEITPSSWRMVANMASGMLFIVGEVAGGLVVWYSHPEIENVKWRWLIMVASAPAFVIATNAALFLSESASWLALQGEDARATEILQSIRWWNRVEQEPIEFSAPVTANAGNTVSQQLDVVAGPMLQFTTAIVCFSCFVLNLSYYGGYYAFPFVLGETNMGVSPALAIVFGALWELPGYGAALVCTSICGRRASILVYLAFMTSSIVMFVAGAGKDGYVYQSCLHVGFAGMKCWVNMGFCIIYQYASEIYPTNARSVGTGVCFGCGRIGAISAPFFFEVMISAFSWQVFFYAIACICMANAFLILLLPFETKGLILPDVIADIGEGDPLMKCVGDRKV